MEKILPDTEEQNKNALGANMFRKFGFGSPDEYLNIAKYCDFYGCDWVIENNIDYTDDESVKRCFGAVIRYWTLNDGQKKRFYTALWLLSDLIHGWSGSQTEYLDKLNELETRRLARFALKVGMDGSWGLDQLGPNSVYSLVCILREAHKMNKGHLSHASDQPGKISTEIFELTSEIYLRENERIIDRPLFMHVDDSLYFLIYVVYLYPLENLYFKKPTPKDLFNFFDQIYDDYIGEEHEDLLVRLREDISKDSPPHGEFDWIDSEIRDYEKPFKDDYPFKEDYPEKKQLLLDFFDFCLEHVREQDC
jgi:hypothetical protein